VKVKTTTHRRSGIRPTSWSQCWRKSKVGKT